MIRKPNLPHDWRTRTDLHHCCEFKGLRPSALIVHELKQNVLYPFVSRAIEYNSNEIYLEA